MTAIPTWFEGFTRDVLARWPATEQATFLDLPALLVNGHPFCALYDHDIAVRLDDPTRARAMERPAARPFEPEGQKPPREWILLTVPSSAAERFSEEWSRQAYEYVKTLPPRTARRASGRLQVAGAKDSQPSRRATARRR